MATFTVRQPSSPATRAVRAASWARRGEETAKTLPRRATPVWSDLYSLQPPTAATPICVGPDTAALASTAALAAPEPTGGPAADTVAAGWFESTWELQQGLDIAEGLPNDVPLEAWLQVYLQA